MKRPPSNGLLLLYATIVATIILAAIITLTQAIESSTTRTGSKHQNETGESSNSPSVSRTKNSRKNNATAKRPLKSLSNNEVKSSKSDPTTPQETQLARLQTTLYNNTPPVAVTYTRDFVIDVARHPMGTTLTVIRGFDKDGDPLTFSLRPALVRDASEYFSINSTSGELKLANKQFKYFMAGGNSSADQMEPAMLHEDESDAMEQASRNLYFLDVAIDDGHYSTNVELQIHILDSSSGQLIGPGSAVDSVYGLLKHKADEYFESLNKATSSNGNVNATSAIVYPSYANPSLGRPNSDSPASKSALDDDDSNVAVADGAESLTTVPAMADHTVANETRKSQQPLESVRLVQDMSEFDPPTRISQQQQQQQSSLPQPMVISLAITCSCLMIALVLLMFIVPLSVKRLKKRLENVELQHEHLSQKTSNGSASFISSSNLNGNSSISQFTLGSDVSCIIRGDNGNCIGNVATIKRAAAALNSSSICRQSSLDSSLTTPSSLFDRHNYPTNQGILNYQQQSRVLMNGSIITNPVYLDQHHTGANNLHPLGSYHLSGNQQPSSLLLLPGDRRDLKQQPSGGNQSRLGTANRLSINQQIRQQMSNDDSCYNVYYPIDGDDFYSTINDYVANGASALEGHNNQHLQQQQQHERLRFSQANLRQHPPAELTAPVPPLSSNHDGWQKPVLAERCNANDYSFMIQNDGEDEHDEFTAAKLDYDELANRASANHSPAANSDSGSSLRSLTRFLSLPARHSAPQQGNSRGSAGEQLFGDDLGKLLAPTSGAQQAAPRSPPAHAFNAKTIARGSQVCREPFLSQGWEIERHKLKFISILDEGQFGLVWKCELREAKSNLTVAVKSLKNVHSKSNIGREELLAEIEIMKLVCQHPNVVKILHCCTTDTTKLLDLPLLLVMEYIDGGKLQSFLEKSRLNHSYSSALNIDEQNTAGDNATLTSRDLIKFIYHVAKGMEYISSNCIVHRDLASRNILISSKNGVCKIGDFGMARHINSLNSAYERHLNNTKIPVRWMAPEVLLDNQFTIKSDVYSFGILMWEIITLGSTPYRHLKTEQIIDEVARKGKRPGKPKYCHDIIYKIMARCWNKLPEQRPTFRDLVAELDELFTSSNDYIQLDQYPDHDYYNIPKTSLPNELI